MKAKDVKTITKIGSSDDRLAMLSIGVGGMDSVISFSMQCVPEDRRVWLASILERQVAEAYAHGYRHAQNAIKLAHTRYMNSMEYER